MKVLLVLLVTLCSTPSFAVSKLETKVLTELISKSSFLKLNYDFETEFDQQLPELIATHLSYNYEQSAVEGRVVLSVVDLSCENVKGATSYKCRVRFSTADFTKKDERSLQGPEEDSAVLFYLDVSLKEDGAPMILNKIVTAYRAG